MVVARRYVLAILVPAATSSAMVFRTLGSLRRRPNGSIVFPWNTGGGIGPMTDGGSKAVYIIIFA